MTRSLPGSLLLHATALLLIVLYGTFVDRPQIRTPRTIQVQMVSLPERPQPATPQEAPAEQPAEQPAVLVAALREGMLRLAGRHGDGAIVNWLSARDVETVAPVVAEAAAAAGRPTPEVVARIFVAPTTDRDLVVGMGRYAIAAYLTVPVYAAFHEWLGRGEQLAEMQRLWREGDRKAALEAIPESLVDELIVHGSPEQCREHIGRYCDAGITTPALALLPFGLDQRQALRDLAPT